MANASPDPYVMPPAMTATWVMSKLLIHRGRVVGVPLARPTPKRTRMLSAGAQTTVGVARMKKHRTTGKILPTAVEVVADGRAFQGLGSVASGVPSSSWTSVLRKWSLVGATG